MKKFPNALVIMLGVILLAWILTFLIPKGTYQRITNPETEQTVVVGGSYAPAQGESLSWFDLFLSVPEGIISRAGLIALILLVGGSFYVIEKTGALGQGLQRVVMVMRGREYLALILVSLMFAAAGATIGLQEEILGMLPILILFYRSLGYNILVALAGSFGSAILGAAFSPANPFAVVLAQQEAELPLMSGSLFRLVFLLIALGLWNAYLIYYARRNPVEKIPMEASGKAINWRHGLVLALLVGTFSAVTYGMIMLDWGFNHLSACFFALGLAGGLISGMGLNGTATAFVDGFREMIFACVVIGLAGSITILLEKGVIIDTIVHGLFMPMEGLPASLSALGMLVSQALLHFPVPSYSGQAVLTMPILTPLSDLVGVSRQVTVLAYQYGAVNMDLIVPTNGALMAVLALGGISYDKWLRFIWKPVLLLFAVAAVAILVALQIGYA